ncbi:hypothetical protein NP233_g11081 [Leucocoprinus birnbaumii]|uniref:TPR-like protein n=1 Tax=Leucocoprinus birnbaumii TaxID=56174 RepID=A0AAD5YR98_9AGAR|nr:hypothetical protein NP233_g11081 [Leucocoprinus birnbaumii]
MSNPKERHYWSQLRAALTAGQWRSSFPAKAPNATPLPWSELFRKFNKHCVGFQDVSEIALQTRVLGSLLATDTDDEDVIGNSVQPPLDIGIECTLSSERIEELQANYESLKSAKESNSLNFTLAYFAFALNKPEECLAYISRISDVVMLQSHIPTPNPQHASGASFMTLSDSSLPEIRDGRAWAMTETFRSICLQGMSYEKLYPSEPLRALKAYQIALPLFTILTSEFTLPSSTQATGKLDFTPFYQLRELWRWVERLLWRAIVLSARLYEVHEDEPTNGSPESLWVWFDHYAKCSAGWPATFRTAHRSTVTTIYLRAFVLRYRVLSESPVYIPKTPAWLHQARTLCTDYRMILSASTKFPRAGEKNIKVEEFVDLCVAVWEAAGGMGEHAGWVIDILWWATRYTFNSPRIYRHMTRLFHLSGDTPLAIRTLKLYVQIVGKSYQASREGLHEEDIDSDSNWVQTLVFGMRMICRYAVANNDEESIEDVKYAGTLIEKARSRLSEDETSLTSSLLLAEGVWHSVMALKEEDPYTRPNRLLASHQSIIRSIQTQPSSSGYFHLAISFARSGGPWRDLDKAIESAGLALEADPKEIRYWHLLGLLLSAKEKWREAVEILERGAELDREVSGELTDDEGDDGNEDDDDEAQQNGGLKPETIGLNGHTVPPPSEQSDIIHSTISPPSPPQAPKAKLYPAYKYAYVLSPNESTFPPASSLIRSMLEKSPPSKRDVYEYSLQLRMTQVALNEVVEGPEGAECKWVEVFAWIAEKKGVLGNSDHSHRQSMESGFPSSMMDKTFATTQTQVPTAAAATGVGDGVAADGVVADQHEAGISPIGTTHSALLAPTPIPITISPATPTTDSFPPNASEPNPMDEVLSQRSGFIGSEKKNSLRVKRSTSIDRGDTNKTKEKVQAVQQMLKNRVHKGRQGITTVSRKIGHGVRIGRHHGGLRRSNSTPDFHEVIRNASYQASSIHSRRRLGSFLQLNDSRNRAASTTLTTTDSIMPPPPPPPPPLPQTATTQQTSSKPMNNWQIRENRLLSQLWLMSAATFRRLGKIEQAKGAIQEAEVKDEANPGVWVQLGLYYLALRHREHAIDAFQKALMIDTDHVPATVHLSSIYLTPSKSQSPQPQASSSVASSPTEATTIDKLPPPHNPPQYPPPSSSAHSSTKLDIQDTTDRSNVDLAAGLLSHLTQGKGWDVPEAWYFLAKAYGVQGRKEKEVEALRLALQLTEGRGVREVGSAIGWCI